MRKILIVGAGQAGLQLALGLQARGYEVTVMSDRTPDEIRAGDVMSTQCMFGTALGHERALGLDLWDATAPRVEGVGVSVAGPDGTRAVDWLGRLDAYGQSVDQRIKMAEWLDLFVARGGGLVVHPVAVSDIEWYGGNFDLVLLAAGKGPLAGMFDRDSLRSPYERPMRSLAVAYVHGLAPRPDRDTGAVQCNLIPGVGELFVIPALTLSGPCDILFFEGVPGGPLDVFQGIRSPQGRLNLTLSLMRQYVPWEYERTTTGVELTDSGATLCGRYAPTVRRPVAQLECGAPVLGVADVVVANDPITGQGSNNAARCAAIYLSAIEERGERPFDRAWMEATFEAYWSSVAPATKWTNAMLSPPPPHVLDLIAAAQSRQPIADRFANGFDEPADFEHWFFDPTKAATYVTTLDGNDA
ncbi:styrene monooxygenase/indole monooxygenase family protein [Yinghuangia seranimata]|uniref:styrene monooxygenase/indole monooxygenase family protein n=1 Tax=Yinghuangia seranimata TaxID=408067 RepID=UPI00248B6FC2|nr:styrene monooxygenase/indole monooxygenase family protein [Yinghuangia seranimata]MDI2128224.1 FAD-binding oxidoreductase [Yinghuangia seranimata]